MNLEIIKIDLSEWECQIDNTYLEQCYHILDEKLQIDKETLRFIKKAIHSDYNPTAVQYNKKAPIDYIEDCELIFINSGLPPFKNFVKWNCPDPIDEFDPNDILKESILLILEGKKLLTETLKEYKGKKLEKLKDGGVDYLLLDVGKPTEFTLPDDLIPLIEVEDNIDIESYDELIPGFSIGGMETEPVVVKKLSDLAKFEVPTFIITESHTNIDLNLPKWEVDCHIDQDFVLEFLDEKLEFVDNDFFVEDIKIIDNRNCLNSLNLDPWELKRTDLASLKWGILEEMTLDDLECFDTLSGGEHDEVDKIADKEGSTPTNSSEPTPEAEDSINVNPLSCSMEVCKDDTAQELTAYAFPDTMCLTPFKRDLDFIEHTELDNLVATQFKKLKTNSSKIETHSEFPLQNILEFSELHALGSAVEELQIIEEDHIVNYQNNNQIEIDQLIIEGYREIVMNISMFDKNRDIFNILQNLQKKSLLQIIEKSLPFKEKDFDFFVNLKLGLIEVPVRQLDQLNVFTDRLLVVENLMQIAHQCKEIIVIIINDEGKTTQNDNKLDNFIRILSKNLIHALIINPQEYPKRLCDLINLHCSSSKIELNEEDPEQIFLQECDISNPFLIHEILKRDTLQNLVLMTHEARVDKYKDIMTVELLESLHETFIQELNTIH